MPWSHCLLNFVLNARRPVASFVHDPLAPDFAGEHHKLRRCHRFARYARFRVFRQEQIHDRIGNLVGNLVGMAFGNAFGREEIAAAHLGEVPMDIKKALCLEFAL